MRDVIHTIGITAVALAFYLLLTLVEQDLVLSKVVVPPPGVKLPDWLASFRFWGSVGIGAAFATSLIWYALGQWVFKVDSWRDSNRRVVWLLLFGGPILGVVVGAYFIQPVQEGAWIAYTFYTMNALLSYHVETAAFSPPVFKYTPFGSLHMRIWDSSLGPIGRRER